MTRSMPTRGCQRERHPVGMAAVCAAVFPGRSEGGGADVTVLSGAGRAAASAGSMRCAQRRAER